MNVREKPTKNGQLRDKGRRQTKQQQKKKKKTTATKKIKKDEQHETHQKPEVKPG
jgi:hypothetical protein